MTQKTIAIYGATGFTGQLVAHELANHNVRVVISGRNHQKLQVLADEIFAAHGAKFVIRVAAVDDTNSLDALLHDVDALINCAGPFSDYGAPIAEAAIRNKVHYLDTTGEQGYMNWLLEECDEKAAKAGVALLSACAFEYAVGDFAAEYALREGAVHIAVCYAARNMGTSRGTKKSALRALSGKGLTYLHGRLVERRPAYRLFDVPFPGGSTKKAVWFPGGEALQVPRRGGVTWVESCIVMGENTAHLMATISGAIPALVKLTRPLTDKLIGMSSDDPYENSKGEPSFLVIAFDPRTGEPLATLRGGDPYIVTAKIIVEAATRVVQKTPIVVGFTSAAALFDADSFLEAVGISAV